MVVTSLAAQLKQLEAPQTSLLVHRTKKASFLFSEKDAANFDRDTIYELGLSGLEELKKLNKHFAVFEKTLFDVSSKTFERTIQTAEVNEKLNHNIKEISILLCPYFLLKPSHKVLEWLINRYHVHQFNIDELLLLSLPYHETMTFARLLQLFSFSEDRGKWNWLAPVKKAGVPLSKTALLNRAATDTAFFKFVCDMPVEAIKVYGEKSGVLNTLFSFYCATIVGGLETAKEITDLHVSLVLPSVMSALSSHHVDFTSSAYIILARLATKTKLSEKLVSTLFNKLSKVRGDTLKHETTLLFIVLSQTSDCILPRAAVSRLISSPHLLTSINYWASRSLVTLPFIKSLLTSSLQVIQDSSTETLTNEQFRTFVDKLLTLTFDDTEAVTVVKVLVNEWKGLEENWYRDTLNNLQVSCPKGFDIASSEVVSVPSQAAVLRQLLGLKSSRNSVFDCLIHPNPDIRCEALKTISKTYTPDQVGWLCETVTARLEDDSTAVVELALNCKSALQCADKSSLSRILQRVVIRCWSDAAHGSYLKKALYTLLEFHPEDDTSLLDLVIFPIVATNTSLALHKKQSATESRLINFINDNMKNKETMEQVAWSSLEKDILPKYSDISNYLLELCQIHPVYKFLSLLLLAKEPHFIDSSLLSDYLSADTTVLSEIRELVDGKSLKMCMDVCKEGHIPLQPSLFYLSKSVHSAKRVYDAAQTKDSLKIRCPDVSSPAYHRLINVLKIFIHGCESKNKDIKKAFSLATKALFKKNFSLKEDRMHFLLSCAVFMVDKDVNISSVCVKHLLTLFTSSKKQNQFDDKSTTKSSENDCSLPTQVLSLSSPAIPMLAALLFSSDSTLRTDVLMIFTSLVESFSPIPGYRAFVEQIISNSEELKLDPEQITVLCYTQLSPMKEIRSLLPSDVKVHMKNTLNAMMTFITHPESPAYVCASILEILECVNSNDVLVQLLPVLNKLIGKGLMLDKPQSKVVKFILKKFDNTQIESFNKEEVWKAFDNILSDFTTALDEKENVTTNPAAYLLNLLPPLLFDNLSDPKRENQERFLTSIISQTYESDNVKVTNSVSNFFKKVNIEGEIIASFMSKWFIGASSQVRTTPGSKKIRKSLSNIPNLEILETPEWKKGVFLLEQIQNKSKFSDCTILIPVLFEVLKKCLLFEHQAPVEYSKQLILSILLQCCQSIGLSPISPEMIQVDLIVQCLRVSQNPQTHHHALLTLTIIANILPDNVLHSIMEIFTFIGTSIARQDDAYSFQIISKLVETIIPILIKGRENEVIGVMRVFVAAMLDIPEHRRQVLLLKLLNTLGPSQHLWLFLALVFESHVLKQSSSQNKESNSVSGVKPKKLEVASQLCSEFDVPVLLETSARLLELSNLLPHDKDEKTDVKLPIDITAIFDVKANTGKQLRHFKYTLLGFLSFLLSSDIFIQQIAFMSEEESLELENDLRRVMELCLSYVRELSKHQEKLNSQHVSTSKYWKVMINQAYDVLDKVVGVLPVSSFVSVICSLLEDENCLARKVVELVTWRLGQGRPAPPPLLRPLLEPLANISLSDSVDPLTRQTALIALKLLTRHLAPTYMEDFSKVLEQLTGVLCSETLPSWEVTGGLVLCLGELASSLGAHSISQLSRFVPALLKILQDSCNNGELFLLSCVTCLHKIVDTLSNFLSPYLEKIIFRACCLTASLQASESQEKVAPIISRLKSIRSKLASSIEGRVLVPAISECYTKILKKGEVNAVAPLMALLTESFSMGAKATPELSSLLLRGLAFRSETTDPGSVDLVEPYVLSALISLVLKLSESAFRPLFHKIYDWAIRGSNNPLRAITFYRLSCGLAERLRGLFVLFAGLLVANSASLLDKYNTAKEKSLPTSEEGSIILVESIIKTLTYVFTHDSHNFLNKERFDLLMQPLVDQLENELGGEEGRTERNEKLLTPCLASMAGATGDDSLWKQLNYQTLLKMRHHHPQVRLAALESVHQIAKKLGEDFLPLLPETVPFLAELLEDSDESIEKQTHRAIASMEAVLGEPIQKYF